MSFGLFLFSLALLLKSTKNLNESVSVCTFIFFKKALVEESVLSVLVIMNLSASQCKCSSSGSGCESGWTSYLDQSSLSRNRYQCYSLGDGHNQEEEEEDDLSMVSDASSGPPHYCEHDEDCFDEKVSFYSPHLPSELAPAKSKNKKKIKQQQHNSYLDDTASSPVKKNISFSKNEASVEQVLGYSQGFSTTHLRGKSTFKKHFDFLPSSLAGKKCGFKEESGNDKWRL